MKNICYIFGASLEGLPDSFKKEKNDLIIAADGGYDFLAKKNIKPDIVMGDFDSSEMVKESDISIKFPSEKNETDSYLAYLEGKSRGFRTFVFYGCLGGRTDHTLANMQILTKISKEGNKAVFIGNNILRGEKLYIRPIRRYADVKVDTLHEFEPCVMKKETLKLFEDLPSEVKVNFTKFMKHLEAFNEIKKDLVPKSSLICEFI